MLMKKARNKQLESGAILVEIEIRSCEQKNDLRFSYLKKILPAVR